jgi:hypothetical protein
VVSPSSPTVYATLAAESTGTERGADMAAPRSAPQGRPVVAAVRLTEDEAAYIDAKRGVLNRSEWLRLILLAEMKRNPL